MKESVQEHMFVPIGFSEVDNQRKREQKKTTASIIHHHRDHRLPERNVGFSRSKDEQQGLALPGVSVLSSGAKDRARQRHNEKRCLCCKFSTLSKLAFVIILLTYYRELKGIISIAKLTDISPPSIKRDYSNVRSVHDLSSEIVKPWCYNDMHDCPCTDPLIPEHRNDESGWEETHQSNNEVAEKHWARSVDVVFYGDSITEGWHGKQFGKTVPRFAGAKDVFQSLFSTDMGGDYEGLALGIAGDTSPNLLWRLQKGELPGQLYPSIFWLLIGTNDIGKNWCSPELVVIGILRIVEEIRSRKPSATVVINGLLPRSFDGQGFVAKGGTWKPALWEDIKAINDELRQYATNRDKVEYFETGVFFVDKFAADEVLQIDHNLMPDFLHPNAPGYQLWGEEIAAMLGKLLVHK